VNQNGLNDALDSQNISGELNRPLFGIFSSYLVLLVCD
jgi:hypothetical protein